MTVVDARPVFATPERFPDADEIVVSWPDRFLAEQIRDGRVGNDSTSFETTEVVVGEGGMVALGAEFESDFPLGTRLRIERDPANGAIILTKIEDLR